MQDVDIRKTVWYKIVNVSKSTYTLYKYDSKKGYQFLPHGNKGTHKLRMSTKQEKSNSIIDWLDDKYNITSNEGHWKWLKRCVMFIARILEKSLGVKQLGNWIDGLSFGSIVN